MFLRRLQASSLAIAHLCSSLRSTVASVICVAGYLPVTSRSVVANEQATGVVILGMHRSGTSAVAGFLAKAGFFAGEEGDLLAAAEDNPKGFFERTDVNQLNDSLLAEAGGAWDEPPGRDRVAENGLAWLPKVDELLGNLLSQADGRPLVLKDPRVSLLLPAWLQVLDDRRFVFLLVDRSPMDTALSMRKRDGRPLYVALALWQLYTADLLEGLNGRRVLVVRYEDFVEDPARTTAWLMGELAGAFPDQMGDGGQDAGDGGGPERADFVSRDMRHHRTEAKDVANEQVLTGTQLALYKWLRELPEGWVELHPPAKLRAEAPNALLTTAEYQAGVADRAGMEGAYDDERHKALYFEQSTELKDHHIERLEAEFRKLRQRVEQGEARVAEMVAWAEQLQAANAALEDELRQLREDRRAAVSNLVSVARRGWPNRSADQSPH